MNIEHFIQSKFEHYKTRGNTIFRVPCVYHDERQPSMDINMDENSKYYGRCICWGCGKSVSIKKYFLDMGWGVESLPENLKIKKFFLETKKDPQQKLLKNNKLPENFKLFFLDPKPSLSEAFALRYLYSRGFDDATIRENLLGFVGIEDSEFAESIIIPYMNDKYEICYFIARKYRNSNIRYVNLKTEEGFYSRSDVIFNQIGFDLVENIILCEGAFNAMTYNMLDIPNTQAIATNGTKLGDTIIAKILRQAGISTLIFAFDYKTDATVEFLYRKFLGRFSMEIITFEDDRDINNILISGGKKAVLEKFYNKKKYIINPFK